MEVVVFSICVVRILVGEVKVVWASIEFALCWVDGYRWEGEWKYFCFIGWDMVIVGGKLSCVIKFVQGDIGM